MKSRGRIILKKAGISPEKKKIDLEFFKRTEEALKRWDKGEFVSMDGDKFIEELHKW